MLMVCGCQVCVQVLPNNTALIRIGAAGAQQGIRDHDQSWQPSIPLQQDPRSAGSGSAAGPFIILTILTILLQAPQHVSYSIPKVQ